MLSVVISDVTARLVGLSVVVDGDGTSTVAQQNINKNVNMLTVSNLSYKKHMNFLA